MATHELKTWPGSFDAVWRRNKTAELRKLDRDFRVGDTLVLRCYLPDLDRYDGRSVDATISHIVHVGFGLQDGYGMLSMKDLRNNEFDPDTPDADKILRDQEFEIEWVDGDASGRYAGRMMSWTASMFQNADRAPSVSLRLYGPGSVEGSAPPFCAIGTVTLRDGKARIGRSWYGRLMFEPNPSYLYVRVDRIAERWEETGIVSKP